MSNGNKYKAKNGRLHLYNFRCHLIEVQSYKICLNIDIVGKLKF